MLEEKVNELLKKTFTLAMDVIAQHDAGSAGTPATNEDGSPWTPSMGSPANPATPASGAQTLTLLYDTHGSTRAVLSLAAEVIQRYSYSAYGQSLGFQVATAVTSLLYSGEWTNGQAQGNLQYLRDRWMMPGVGRFTQMDRMEAGVGAGGNRSGGFLYTRSNPISGVDPTGKYEVDVHQFLTQYLATMAGFNATTAEEFAKQTQELDKSGDSRNAFASELARQRYHFVSEADVIIMKDFAVDMPSHLEYVGEYLHALQDSYSHDVGVGMRTGTQYEDLYYYGHALHGHEPDWTWKDVPKTMLMAKDTYDRLIALRDTHGGTGAVTPWATIEPTVRSFMAYRPETFYGSQNFYGPFAVSLRTASANGYKVKIGILDSSYPAQFPSYELEGRTPKNRPHGFRGGFTNPPMQQTYKFDGVIPGM